MELALACGAGGSAFLISLWFCQAMLAHRRSAGERGLLALIDPLLASLAPLNAWLPLPGLRERIERQLRSAGDPSRLTANKFLALKELGAGTGLLAGWLLFGGGFLTGLAAAAGFWAPNWWLRRRVDARHLAARRSLPGVMDLMILALDAGLDFAAAVRLIVGKSAGGPLAEELGLVLQMIRIGKTRSEALKAMADRASLAELTSMTAALVQADELGVRLARTLRIQATQLRLRRSQRAEEKAAKASVRMLLPLIMFVLPAVLIIVAGPIVLQLIESL